MGIIEFDAYIDSEVPGVFFFESVYKTLQLSKSCFCIASLLTMARLRKLPNIPCIYNHVMLDALIFFVVTLKHDLSIFRAVSNILRYQIFAWVFKNI